MSKFTELYPQAPHQSEIQFEGSLLIKADDSDEPFACFVCGSLTHWIDCNFEAAVCSEECERAAWNDYFVASAIAPIQEFKLCEHGFGIGFCGDKSCPNHKDSIRD